MNIRCPECQTTFRVDPSRIPPSGIRARCSRCRATFAVAGTAADSDAAAPQATAMPAAAAPSPEPAADSGDDGAPGAGTATDEQREPRADGGSNEQSEPDDAGGVREEADTTGGRDAPGTSAETPDEQVTRHEPEASHATMPGEPRPADRGDAGSPGTDTGTAPRDDRGGMRAAPSSGTGPAPVEGAAPAPVFGSRDPGARAKRIARALVSDIVAYHPKRRDESLARGTLRTEFRDEIMKSWEEYVAQVGLEMAKSTPYFREALNAILARGQATF